MTATVRAALTLLLAGALTWAATGLPVTFVLGCGAAAAVGLAALAVAATRLPQPSPQPVDTIPAPRTAPDRLPAKETHP